MSHFVWQPLQSVRCWFKMGYSCQVLQQWLSLSIEWWLLPPSLAVFYFLERWQMMLKGSGPNLNSLEYRTPRVIAKSQQSEWSTHLSWLAQKRWLEGLKMGMLLCMKKQTNNSSWYWEDLKMVDLSWKYKDFSKLNTSSLWFSRVRYRCLTWSQTSSISSFHCPLTWLLKLFHKFVSLATTCGWWLLIWIAMWSLEAMAEWVRWGLSTNLTSHHC